MNRTDVRELLVLDQPRGPRSSHIAVRTQQKFLLAAEVSMNRLLGICALVLLFGLPAFSQAQRMSPDDQARFDSYYSRWMHDQQTNDRGDMVSMERRMQDLMNRYGIPSNTPYDVIAQGETGGYYGDRDRDRDHDRDRDRGYAGNWQGQARLSPDDQRRFDEEYAKWQQSTARNDRDDINKHARNMENIMARYNIPPNTPFDEIASNAGAGYGGGYNGNYNGSYAGTYGRRGYQGMLSLDDQHRFDSAYQHWLHERQENDRGGMEKQERTMQDIMSRYNIPQGVPYDAIASGGQGY
jgi:polyhydroxyalkanoate synthesis regulator phasin